MTLWIVAACQHAGTPPAISSKVFEGVHEDKVYDEALRKYSRSETVHNRFDTLYFINVTLLHPDFQAVLRERIRQRIDDVDFLASLDKKISFFVSLYSPDDDIRTLAKNKGWEFALKIADHPVKFSGAKIQEEKEHWYPFFSYINRWSSEFFVSFDVPEGVSVQDLWKNSPSVELSFSTFEAKTVIVWDKNSNLAFSK
jgi:hypothetical protein